VEAETYRFWGACQKKMEKVRINRKRWGNKMKYLRITICIFISIMFVNVSVAQEKHIKLDNNEAKKFQEMQKRDEMTKKMNSLSNSTRTDMGYNGEKTKNRKNEPKCNFDREKMKRLADSIDSSRDKAGILHIPQVINQVKELDKDCNNNNKYNTRSRNEKAITLPR
jgi:hypothetical protein